MVAIGTSVKIVLEGLRSLMCVVCVEESLDKLITPNDSLLCTNYYYDDDYSMLSGSTSWWNAELVVVFER